jgi:D-arabinose 1-dehydrogenase-like Zn-dependent alcohol dehydrogenase
MGASEVLVPKAHVGKELMAMGGVDVILATSNDLAQASEALEGLTPEGRMVLLGLPSHEATSLTLPHRRMLGMGLTVLGGKQGPRQDLRDLLTYAAAGAVLPHIEPYPLGQVARAMQRLVERRVRYRAVLLHADA